MSDNLHCGSYFDVHRPDDRKVRAIETVSDPEQRSENSDRSLQLRGESVEGFMLTVWMRSPVVAGDIAITSSSSDERPPNSVLVIK